jgi:pyruvate kinase
LKDINFSRTKIVATLGPATDSPKVLEAMIREGVNVARLNFSHGSHEDHAKRLKQVRDINKKLGTQVAILQDLQGPKIRVGILKKTVKIKEGDVITFRTDVTEQTDEYLPIQYGTFAKDVNVGDPVLADDGKVEMTVISTNKENEVKLRIDFGSEIKSRKGVNLPRTDISIPTITDKDYKDIDFAIEHNVEWLALSFVRSGDELRTLRELIRLKKGNSKIIAKLEKPEAIDSLDEIIEYADAVMVARGDLGVEIPMEEVPAVQKRIIRKANKAAKPVIVATQMMESMIENRRPTRAEASDVANAVVDGADAVMLSGETSVGNHPVQVVSSMKRILQSVEKEGGPFFYTHMAPGADFDPSEDVLLSQAITITACQLARQTGAKAVVGMTRSGFTAYQLSRCRPEAHIFAFTNNKELVTTLNLVWGVQAFYYDGEENTDVTVQNVQQILKKAGHVKVGDIVINTASMPRHKVGLTNMIKIGRIR